MAVVASSHDVMANELMIMAVPTVPLTVAPVTVAGVAGVVPESEKVKVLFPVLVKLQMPL